MAFMFCPYRTERASRFRNRKRAPSICFDSSCPAANRMIDLPYALRRMAVKCAAPALEPRCA
jgi:hypothetical protein